MNSKLWYYLTFKEESLNNFLKQSESDEFHIRFVNSSDNPNSLISVTEIRFYQDNKLNSKHFELLNMHERIKTLNGKMKITSSDHIGTSFLFELYSGLS